MLLPKEAVEAMKEYVFGSTRSSLRKQVTPTESEKTTTRALSPLGSAE